MAGAMATFYGEPAQVFSANGNMEASRDSICISGLCLCEEWVELDGFGVPLPLILSSTSHKFKL